VKADHAHEKERRNRFRNECVTAGTEGILTSLGAGRRRDSQKRGVARDRIGTKHSSQLPSVDLW
jgi:hypothetical protein